MYYDFFGLNQPPFRITPDTNLFFPGANRGAVLEALIYAIQNGEGIIKVVGEVGSGKTMLCRMLEQELPKRIEIVYLANPRLPPENVLHAIAFELKLPVQPSAPRLQVLNTLQDYLLRKHSENGQVVVFVEEAQGMPIATLEEIRLLSNLETRQNKLLQIVLFGQPELDQRLARPEIRQLKERITYTFNLAPFPWSEIREYLNSRLRSCGYRRGELFTPGAVRTIGWHSRGLVRRINILADKSLLAAYADNSTVVSVKHVRMAAQDSEFVGSRRQLWFGLAAMAGGALLLALVVWSLRQPPGAVLEPAVAPASPPAGTVESATPSPATAVTSEPPLQGAVEVAAPQTDPAPAPETAPAEPSREAPPEETEAVDTPSAINNVSDVPAGPPPTGGFIEVDAATSLTAAESERLHRQLASLPPEDLEPAAPPTPESACQLCWSLVYRPLYETENL